MSYSPSLEFPISIRHSCHENMFTYFVSIFLSHDYATSNFNDFHTSSNPSKRSNLVTNTILWCYSNYYIAFFYNLFFLYNLRNNVYVFCSIYMHFTSCAEFINVMCEFICWYKLRFVIAHQLILNDDDEDDDEDIHTSSSLSIKKFAGSIYFDPWTVMNVMLDWFIS